MTDATTRNLAREVAEALGWERNGELWFYHLQPNDVGYYREELPDWEHDLNACARDLTREGYRVVIRQEIDSWQVYYVPVYLDEPLTIYGSRIDETECEDSNPAVAWCKSFLALCKHVDGKAGENDK